MISFLEGLELLKIREKELNSITNFYEKQKIEEHYQALKLDSEQETFWQDLEFAAKSKQLSELAETRNAFLKLCHDHKNIRELLALFYDMPESAEAQELAIEIEELCKRISRFKIELLLGGEYDNNNCFLSITPGAGGTESQDWAEMLLRMYLRFCERNKFAVIILDRQVGSEAGIKSVALNIRGKNAYGLLKSEAGIHRLVRISPFDANKRRHTSFAAVFVSPEVEQSVVEIKPEDLKIDTYRSGGAGGQHVNTTDSAVRITHLPTGIVVQCQNERSQHQNKQQAMNMLFSKLVAFEAKKEKDAENRFEKQKIEWGSQIRSYVLHPYKMVKDHRTGLEAPQPELVLDGQLSEFIEAFLVQAS
jgi:peptide chain release factor 2